MSLPLLATSDLPKSLWDSDHDHGKIGTPKGLLQLPAQFVEAYAATLRELNLFESAVEAASQNDDLGSDEGEEGAREHFVRRFAGSCSRVQMYVLDPHFTFKTTRDVLMWLASGGTFQLLDIPVGAGAGSAALLSCIAELRSKEVISTLPLKVHVVGGDNNPHQLKIAESVLPRLRPWWLENGIDVSWDLMEWNVLNDESTMDLTTRWRDGFSKNVYPMLIASNFSNFLGKPISPQNPRRWIDEADACLRRIIGDAAAAKAPVLWVEPITNTATKHFLPKLRNQVFGRFKRIQPVLPNDPQSLAETRHPIAPNQFYTTRASGIHLRPS